jgi:hypothetical protein
MVFALAMASPLRIQVFGPASNPIIPLGIPLSIVKVLTSEYPSILSAQTKSTGKCNLTPFF